MLVGVETKLKNKTGLKISENELLMLFTYATSGTHFLFNDNFYEQVDGVGMRSPLAPTPANLSIGHHEGKWIVDYE